MTRYIILRALRTKCENIIQIACVCVGGGGDICPGVFVHRDKCPGGIYPGGKCPGGICPGVLVRTPILQNINKWMINVSKYYASYLLMNLLLISNFWC